MKDEECNGCEEKIVCKECKIVLCERRRYSNKMICLKSLHYKNKTTNEVVCPQCTVFGDFL